ncbi:DEAD/DEAH box helicase [Arsenicicoccus cauae]|uniref:DEAD/DEAH box helicase n=1 Tax=Arsenicicoccus cauae TaxID=2663847 RepID=UPI00370D10DF
MSAQSSSGAPKKARWSTSKKVEARRGPSKPHRGQGPTAGRDERRPYTRDERSYADRGPRSESRDERGPRREFNRDERPERRPFNRDDRPQRSFDRDERRPFNRGDRPHDRGVDRDDRGQRSYDRGDRPQRRFERDDRGQRSYDRGDRPQRRFDRDERGPRSYDRGDRPQRRFERDDRGPRSYERGDRPQRRFERDDRGPRSYDRGDRPQRRFDRDERGPRSYDRGDRGYQRADRSRTWTDREEREAMGLSVDVPAEAAPVEVGADNGFAALGLPTPLVERLARDGITTPFPIQQATIPDALAGRDVLGRGQTGSGKTLSFGLPLIATLAAGGKAAPGVVRSIILVPTRELAQQVSDALQPLVHVMGLRHKLVAGGMPYPPQIMALEKGLDVLVATPGRLKDLIDRGAADLSQVEVAVLDEADHMAEMGFLEAISEILDLVPGGGQRLLFSATLDRGIDTVVERYLSDPVTHETDPETASVETMDHHVLLIDPMHKKVITAEVANRTGRTVVFVRTKLGADRVALQLREQGVFAAALHGGLSQVQRNRVLTGFKEGTLPVLVATDVAARGIHVDDVSVVLQVDPPADHKDYLHRSGRTARAGERGTVVTLALPHQRRQMERLVEQAGVDVKPVRTAPGDPLLYDGVGARTPSGEAIEEGRYRRLVEGEPRPQRGHRRGGARYQPHGRRNERSFRGREDRGGRDDRDGRQDRGGRDRSARRYDG